MKKIVMLTVLMMLVTTAVSASNLNGDYNGNPIVKLKSNGALVDTGEVPAIIYDGKTMVPIAALRNLGVDVTWDQITYSVDVKLKQNSVQQSNVSISNALNELKKHGVDFIAMMSGTDAKTTIIYYYNGTSQQLFNTMDSFGAILDNSITSDATLTEISYIDKETLSVSTDRIRDFKNGKITSQQLADEYIIKKPSTATSNNTQQQQTQPQQETQNNTPSQNASGQSKTKAPLTIYSNDGKTYLGKLTANEFDTDSVYNEFGTYGSKFSSTSIMNEFGTYGSKFSSYSAFNEFASDPPIILDGNGNVVGYLTINSFKTGGVSPIGLKQFLEDNGY
jgi:uncharacterized protein YxeA